MKNFFLVIGSLGLLCISGASQADVISFSASKALATTNYFTPLAIGKFDTSLGTLSSITFELDGSMQGLGRVENMSSTASKPTLTVGSILTVKRPDGSILVTDNPSFSQDFSLTRFDGAIDFGGTSGGTTGKRAVTANDLFTSTSASDFTLFSELHGGTIDLSFTAVRFSSATGAGSLQSAFQTWAAGNVKVTYDYVPTAVPEPSKYAMLLAGIGLLALYGKRKSARKISG